MALYGAVILKPIVSLKYFNFEAGSTTANFINLFFVWALYVIIIMIGKRIKRLNFTFWRNVLTTYIDRYLNAVFCISFLKLGFMFTILNWLSELSRQIALNGREGLSTNEIISNVILLLCMAAIIFAHKLKASPTVFSETKLVNHDRLQLLRLFLFALLFERSNSWPLIK